MQLVYHQRQSKNGYSRAYRGDDHPRTCSLLQEGLSGLTEGAQRHGRVPSALWDTL